MYNVHVGYTDTMDSLLRTDFGQLLCVFLSQSCICSYYSRLATNRGAVSI